MDYFGFSSNLAFYATEAFLYVFDVQTGEWNSYAYGLPGDYTLGEGWAKEDYVALLLRRPFPERQKAVVYSSHTQTFNSTNDGAYLLNQKRDHGMAGYWVDGNTFEFLGYSAYDNQFDVEVYSPPNDEDRLGSNYYDECTDQFTAYFETIRFAFSSDYVTANFFAYDTRRGEWTHHYRYFEHDDESYYGNPGYCGQIGFDVSREDDTEYRHIFLYSGETGAVNEFTTTLNAFETGWRVGGNVFGVHDDLSAIGFNPATSANSTTLFPAPAPTRICWHAARIG